MGGLRPCFASVATWVGYDLDGRTDIRWWHSLVFKLGEKARQLNAYAAHARDVKAQMRRGKRCHSGSADCPVGRRGALAQAQVRGIRCQSR
jgi:hypothetical protein